MWHRRDARCSCAMLKRSRPAILQWCAWVSMLTSGCKPRTPRQDAGALPGDPEAPWDAFLGPGEARHAHIVQGSLSEDLLSQVARGTEQDPCLHEKDLQAVEIPYESVGFHGVQDDKSLRRASSRSCVTSRSTGAASVQRPRKARTGVCVEVDHLKTDLEAMDGLLEQRCIKHGPETDASEPKRSV